MVRLLHVTLLTLVLAPGTATASESLDLDQGLHDFGLSPDEAERIRSGDIVVSEPAPSSPRELAVGLTFFVQEPVSGVVAAFRSALDMRADTQIHAVADIRGSLDDFASIVLPADEARRYLDARSGDSLNLSNDEIAAFHAAAADGAAARMQLEPLLRRMLFDRYRAYVAAGLRGMAPYARAGGTVRNPADELRSACEAESLLERYVPPLWRVLPSYPSGRGPNLDEAFYALTYDLDGRPNYVVRHRMVVPFAGGIAVSDRDFYVSHGYNTSQAIAALIPVPEGTMVFYRNRVSTDQLAGLGSSLKQTIGRSVMAKQLTTIFERSRTCFEQQAKCAATVAMN